MRLYSKPRKRTIRGKPSKYWYVRERDSVTGSRRWINTGTEDKEAAAEYRRTLELADRRGEQPEENSLFADAVRRWLQMKKSRMTPAGYRAYASYAKGWIDFFPARASVRAITPRHVERYFVHRALEVSEATRNKERMYLRQFFRWAHDHNLTSDPDPVRAVAKFKEQQRDIRALSPEEQTRLLDACRRKYRPKVEGIRNAGGQDGGKKTASKSKWRQTHRPPSWLYPLVRLALATGLRLGSLCALTWKDVDLRKARLRLDAKRMKARRDFLIPLDADTVAFLRGLKKKAASVRVLELPDERAIARAFSGAVRRAKVEPCRFHDLRATFISDCRRAGVDLEVTARLAGHADISTTARFYREIKEEDLRAAVEKRRASQ